MSDLEILVEEIIDDLCGNPYRKGYGLDEWSEPIKKLKVLLERISIELKGANSELREIRTVLFGRGDNTTKVLNCKDILARRD